MKLISYGKNKKLVVCRDKSERGMRDDRFSTVSVPDFNLPSRNSTYRASVVSKNIHNNLKKTLKQLSLPTTYLHETTFPSNYSTRQARSNRLNTEADIKSNFFLLIQILRRFEENVKQCHSFHNIFWKI